MKTPEEALASLVSCIKCREPWTAQMASAELVLRRALLHNGEVVERLKIIEAAFLRTILPQQLDSALDDLHAIIEVES